MIVCVQAQAFISPPKKSVIPVNIALFVNDITNVNERQELIEVEVTLFLHWRDKNLAFNPTTIASRTKYYYDGDAMRKLQNIWHPNIAITQIRGSQEIHKIFLTIAADGSVTMLKRFNAEIETLINVRRFPFDEQTLKISFIPFTRGYRQVQFVVTPTMEGIAPNAHLSEWKLLSYSGKVTTTSSIVIGKDIPTYVFSIKYKREWMFYLVELLFPLFIIVLLSWGVFWLTDQAAINAVAVTFMALLTIVAFQWLVTSSIPRVSYLTFFKSFVLFSYIIVGLTIVGIIWINNTKRMTSARLARHFRWAFPIFYLVGITIITFSFFI